MPIAWDDALSVGVPVIDRQHKDIVRRASALIDAMKAGHGRHQVRPMLRFLVSYMATHFNAEEQLMMDEAYPGLERHGGEHDRLRREIRRLVHDFDAKGPATLLCVDLNTLVCGWFFDHIVQDDRAVARWVASRDGRPARVPARKRR